MAGKKTKPDKFLNPKQIQSIKSKNPKRIWAVWRGGKTCCKKVNVIFFSAASAFSAVQRFSLIFSRLP
jgi:hypothetical protein